MSVEEKLAQRLLVPVHGTEAEAELPANETLHGVETPAALVAEVGVGGIILFNGGAGIDNVDSPEQLADFTGGLRAAADHGGCRPAPLVAVDQEGGQVVRLTSSDGFRSFPSARSLGSDGDLDMARSVGRARGALARAVGVNLVLGPVADTDVVRSAALEPYGRTFSDDPDVVAAFVQATIEGQSTGGVASTIKHFPNHGQLGADTHSDGGSISIDRSEWDAADRRPFQSAIDLGDPLVTVMTGHLGAPGLHPLATETPATLSPSLTTAVLRDELGFDGVVITDDLIAMDALADIRPGERLVRAIRAGADLLTVNGSSSEALDALLTAHADGRLDEAAHVDAPLRRLFQLKFALGLDHEAGSSDAEAIEAALSAAQALSSPRSDD